MLDDYLHNAPTCEVAVLTAIALTLAISWLGVVNFGICSVLAPRKEHSRNVRFEWLDAADGARIILFQYGSNAFLFDSYFYSDDINFSSDSCHLPVGVDIMGECRNMK